MEGNKTTVVKIKRSNGKIVQGCDIYIGRKCTMGGWNLDQSKWANPFSLKEYGSVHIVISKYREYILQRPDLMNSLEELRGKTLGCWCRPNECHGDVLIELLEHK